jgi:hypothetical protein
MDEWLQIPKDRPKPHPVRWSIIFGLSALILLIRYGRDSF